MPRSPRLYWIAAIIVSWGFDFLFWGHAPGLSILIWVVLGLAAGYALAWREGTRPSIFSYVLTAVILLLGVLNLLRAEPLTRFLSMVGALGGMLLLVVTFGSGDWVRYRLLDYPVALLHLIGAAFSRPLQLFPKQTEPAGDDAPKTTWLKQSAPYLRGLLIAVPVVLILASLLASADLVFNRYIQDFTKLFDIERLPEYIFRLFYILVLAYLLVGILVHAVLPARKVEPGKASSAVKPFLGSIESLIVLIAVDALFLLFVAIQFRYLFGGQANITAEGFTFADYARRGFFELVWVAVISLGLFLLLATITRLETGKQKQVFTIASVALIALVLAILASALQRLLLYQDAYGFTRLRTYTYFFIPWLAMLLIGSIVLQLLNRRGSFALLLGVFSLGFVLTLGLINVDGFIVRQNVARARQGEELDESYFVTLSDDAVPALYSAYQSAQPDLQQKLAVALACKAEINQFARQDKDWRAYNVSEATAARLYQQSDLLKQYPVTQNDTGWIVSLPDGQKTSCFNTSIGAGSD